MAKGIIQYKNHNGGLKDVDVKGRTVTGYFSAFGSKDSDGDIITPGAFLKSISENGPAGSNRIQFLWQHDVTMPMGKPSILKEDPYGLYFEAKVANTTWGNNALSLYDAGVINEHSIGFQTIQSSDKGTHNELTELKLYEGSAVTFGANPNTPFTGMKSEQQKNEFIKKLDSLLKGVKSGALTSDENSYLLDLLGADLKSMANYFVGADHGTNLIAIPDLDGPLNPLKNINQAVSTLDPTDVMRLLNELKNKIS